MGRTEPSVGRPPAAFRKDARAKRAKATVNQLIPSLLSAHPRARRGIEAAELIVNPPPAQKKEKRPQNERDASKTEAEVSPAKPTSPKLSLQVSDTLTAARRLVDQDPKPNKTADLKASGSGVAVLNMASALSPGGGFLNGASSQEESLCMRTTLLPSLKDDYYRLPELGAIFTPDVLVFRDEEAEEVLDKRNRWFVDCISAAMLRDPESDRDELGRGSYVHQKDRELVLQKMKMILRIAQAKGVQKLVLGAWGCGVYGNPVGEVATAWRKVLCPDIEQTRHSKGRKETWDGIEEVVFAIKDPGMAEAFAAAFGDLLIEDGPLSDGDDDDEEEEEDVERKELREKIHEIELRLENTGNPKLKEGLAAVLAGLVSQLGMTENPNEDG